MDLSQQSEATLSEQPLAPVKELIASGSAKQLLAGVEAAKKIAGDIITVLHDVKDNGSVSKLFTGFQRLIETKISERTVIGLVGSTGAGKSSVVNAVLDEEALVPTSALHACTAVITEISYNHDDEPGKRYKAEVEFIAAADWKQELSLLFEDLASLNSQTDASMMPEDADSEIALAKVRAVYPTLERESYGKGESTVKKLVRVPAVKEILGVTKCLHADSASSLYQQLRKYVGSDAEASTGPTEGAQVPAMAVWPLVKVVRVFTKSPVLKNGLVLVDLVSLP